LNEEWVYLVALRGHIESLRARKGPHGTGVARRSNCRALELPHVDARI